MRRPKRLLILLVITGGLVFVGSRVWQHMWEQTLQNNPLALLELVPEAALQVKNFHRSNIENGRKTWEISGDEAGYFKEKEKAVIQRPRLSFYQENGEVLFATGKQGELFLSDGELRKVVLTGAVEVTYRKGRFLTNELVYLHASNQVVSPGRIQAIFDGLEVEGAGMEIFITEERMKLDQNVKTTIRPALLREGELLDGFTQGTQIEGGKT